MWFCVDGIASQVGRQPVAIWFSGGLCRLRGYVCILSFNRNRGHASSARMSSAGMIQRHRHPRPAQTCQDGASRVGGTSAAAQCTRTGAGSRVGLRICLHAGRRGVLPCALVQTPNWSTEGRSEPACPCTLAAMCDAHGQPLSECTTEYSPSCHLSRSSTEAEAGHQRLHKRWRAAR